MYWSFLLLCLCGLAHGIPTPLFEEGAAQTVAEIFGALATDGYTVTAEVLRGGKQEGVEVVTIRSASQEIVVSPTRGMNVMDWRVGTDYKTELGWESPVKDYVNPIYINQMHREGSGFLDGFNEVVARCGFEFVGHAGYDDDEFLTLHGLNAATPAVNVTIEFDENTQNLYLKADMVQAAFKKVNFHISTTLTVPLTGQSYRITDVVRNENIYDHEYMVLYHSNFGGSSVLDVGSKVLVPAEHVWPFNEETIAIAQAFEEKWDDITGPKVDYDETVYNIYPLADDDNDTLAVLVNAAETSGIMVEWNLSELPVFGLWKNLDHRQQGYVVGLEPGTSFSYNRRFNRDLDLVPILKGNSEMTINVVFSKLDAAGITAAKTRIATIQGDSEPVIHTEPLHDEKIPSDNSSGTAQTHTLTALAGIGILATLF